MPYASQAQQRFFHSPGAAAAGIKLNTVKEFDAATNFKKLPKRVGGGTKRKRPRLKDYVGT